MAGYLLSIAILIIALFGVCYAKGETPRWRWGDDEKSSK
jgi:hypothetical protein